MLPLVRDRGGGHWLDEHARQWVEAGLISPDQADAVRHYEEAEAPATEPGRLGLGAEVAVYLGSVIALMAGAVVVADRWPDMVLAGRLGIAAAVALVGFVAGALLARIDDDGMRRLAAFLWVIGAGGIALGAGVLVDEYRPSPGVGALAIGLPVLAIGAGLWRNLERPLQFLTMVVGLCVAGGGVVELTGLPLWWAGVIVWTAAVVVGAVAATGVLRPQLVALMAAAVGAMVGAAMLGDYDERLGPAAAAATAAMVVVFALVDRSTPLLVVGVAGFLIGTQALLATTFTGPASSLVVALAGLTVVAVAVTRSVRRSGQRER